MASTLRPKTAPKTIRAYLARLPADQRAALERLRKLIRAAVPGAEECISYGVPAFRLGGTVLVWFAAASRHCSFFPGAVVADFARELKGFSTSKGTVRFQPDHPLPAALVRKLVRARIARIQTPPSTKGDPMPKRPSENSAMRSKPGASAKPVVRKPPKAKHRHTPGLRGWITHTDLASRDPLATKAWCAKVLGWTMKPVFPTPGGDYHLFAFADTGGGGIRACNPGEAPGSIPFVHVDDAHAAFEAALREGAVAVDAPQRAGHDITIALVRAPGGVLIGFSGP